MKIVGSYDKNYDILYLFVEGFRSGEDESVDDGIYLGFELGGEVPKSATVFDYRRKKRDITALADQLARAMGVNRRLLKSAILEAGAQN